jgi:hypothetical protein
MTTPRKRTPKAAPVTPSILPEWVEFDALIQENGRHLRSTHIIPQSEIRYLSQSVEHPQATWVFLRDAEYPILVDATIHELAQAIFLAQNNAHINSRK